MGPGKGFRTAAAQSRRRPAADPGAGGAHPGLFIPVRRRAFVTRRLPGTSPGPAAHREITPGRRGGHGRWRCAGPGLLRRNFPVDTPLPVPNPFHGRGDCRTQEPLAHRQILTRLPATMTTARLPSPALSSLPKFLRSTRLRRAPENLPATVFPGFPIQRPGHPPYKEESCGAWRSRRTDRNSIPPVDDRDGPTCPEGSFGENTTGETYPNEYETRPGARAGGRSRPRPRGGSSSSDDPPMPDPALDDAQMGTTVPAGTHTISDALAEASDSADPAAGAMYLGKDFPEGTMVTSRGMRRSRIGDRPRPP